MEEFDLPQRPNTSKSDDSIKGSEGIGTEYLSDHEKAMLEVAQQYLPPQMRSFAMQDMVKNLKKEDNR